MINFGQLITWIIFFSFHSQLQQLSVVVGFSCNDGCGISDNYVNDAWCDCNQCEDEDSFTCLSYINDDYCDCNECEGELYWNCTSCAGGCPNPSSTQDIITTSATNTTNFKMNINI